MERLVKWLIFMICVSASISIGRGAYIVTGIKAVGLVAGLGWMAMLSGLTLFTIFAPEIASIRIRFMYGKDVVEQGKRISHRLPNERLREDGYRFIASKHYTNSFDIFLATLYPQGHCQNCGADDNLIDGLCYLCEKKDGFQ